MTEESFSNRAYDLIFVVVNIGKASKVLAEAKKAGVSGGTITLGRGTINSGLLRKFGFHEVRKEVLLMVCEQKHTLPIIEHIQQTFHLELPNRGIIFSAPLSSVVGTHGEKLELAEEDTPKPAEHELFITITEEGKGIEAVEAVKAAGGTGGTILHGLGAFAETVIKVFGIELNSEKDLVLNLVPKSIADQVEKSLTEKLPFAEKDFGILFSIEVENVRGIYDQQL